jgi:hypothetical protein
MQGLEDQLNFALLMKESLFSPPKNQAPRQGQICTRLAC